MITIYVETWKRTQTVFILVWWFMYFSCLATNVEHGIRENTEYEPDNINRSCIVLHYWTRRSTLCAAREKVRVAELMTWKYPSHLIVQLISSEMGAQSSLVIYGTEDIHLNQNIIIYICCVGLYDFFNCFQTLFACIFFFYRKPMNILTNACAPRKKNKRRRFFLIFFWRIKVIQRSYTFSVDQGAK